MKQHWAATAKRTRTAVRRSAGDIHVWPGRVDRSDERRR